MFNFRSNKDQPSAVRPPGPSELDDDPDIEHSDQSGGGFFNLQLPSPSPTAQGNIIKHTYNVHSMACLCFFTIYVICLRILSFCDFCNLSE